MTRERDIQKKIMIWLESQGCRVRKYEGTRVGEPDLYASVPTGTGVSLSLYIEVKNESGRLSNLQRVALNSLRADGHLAVVANSVSTVSKYLAKNGVSMPAPSSTPMYKRWKGMKSRCYNSASKNFDNYGGRGIKVCDRWIDATMGYYNFIEDMGLPPFLNASIDRINVNGDYTPENCRWATSGQQNNNRRENVTLTIGGQTKTVGEWSEHLGIPYSTIYGRVRLGWDDALAISPDKLRTPRPIVCVETGKVYQNVRDASIELGVDPSGFFNIVKGKQKTWGGYHWRYHSEANIN